MIKVRDVVRKTLEKERWNALTFEDHVKHPPWKPNPLASDDNIHIAVRVPNTHDNPMQSTTTPFDRKVTRFAITARDTNVDFGPMCAKGAGVCETEGHPRVIVRSVVKASSRC